MNNSQDNNFPDFSFNKIDNDKEKKVFSDINFQTKLLKILLEENNGEFSTRIIDILKIEYFTESVHLKILFEHLFYLFNKYHVIPDYDVLLHRIKEKENGILLDQLCETIRIMQSGEIKITNKQQVKDSALQFCKKQSLRDALVKASQSWEKDEYDDIAKIINDGLKVGESKETGHDYIKDVEKRLIRSYRNPIPILDGLNSVVGGGLSGGELGVVLSPTGGGKSMLLVKFACTALSMGKKVLYYSMELSENVIAHRFDACLNGLELKNILEYPDVIREKTEEISAKGGVLKIREFPTGNAGISTLKNHMVSLQREGFIPDVIFVDYADIMKASGNFNERRFALTSIYEGLRGMAMEMNLPLWTASQAGRCLGLDTIVETPNGKIKISEIKTGEMLLTHKGFKKVTEVFPIEKQKTYKIKLRSGKEIVVSSKHNFPTEIGELKSIESGLCVGDKLLSKSE